MDDKGLKTGSVLEGRYEILDRIGEGGFGVVYRARQISTGQAVAIKLMLPGKLLSSGDPSKEIARFRREMELIAQLKHPNVVRLIDSGEHEKQLFTVLEYIEGDELAELLLHGGALSLSETVRLMTQVLEALAASHGLGIVHRDLKPQNIMVDRTKRRNAMVLDFGIATLVEDARGQDFVTLTQTGQIHGTPAYMAPEQLEGMVTPQSDVYAWGLIFIECLTGRPVVSATSVASAIFQQLSPEPVELPEALTGTPLQHVLSRATAKTAALRYQSADEALSDLEGIDAAHMTLRKIQMPTRQETIQGEANPFSSTETIELADTIDPDAAVQLKTLATLRADQRATPAEAVTHEAAPRRGRGLAILALPLLGAIAVGVFFLLPRSEEPVAEVIQESACIEGKSVTVDTQGHCCWDGQAWNGERCVGEPKSCPEGYLVNSAKQLCSLPPCGAGKVRPDELHCCWPEQAWSESRNQCIGVPSCPDQTIPTATHCLLAEQPAWLKFTSCDAGNSGDCVELALLLQDGYGVERDEVLAFSMLEQACAKENLTGCYHQALAYRVGIGTPVHLEKALGILERSCSSGQKDACFDLANMVLESEPYRAVQLLEQSCAVAHAQACDTLGSILRFGVGVGRDETKAAEMYEKGCNNRFMYACTHLAWMMRDAEPPQFERAHQLLERACGSGETLACGDLADLLVAGIGGPKDEAKAKELRKRACADGWFDRCD